MNEKLRLLASMMPENADAALIISNTNRRYFTGFVSSLGYLLLTRNEAFLLTDSRYFEAAQKQTSGCEVLLLSSLSKTLGELIKSKNIKNVMLEASAFTLNEANKVISIADENGAKCQTTGELDDLISEQRIIKTSDEIDKIILAQRITENALKETLPLIKEGVCERDLALELEYKMRKAGADGISFDLIAIAGEKTSMPHGVPGDNCVKPGDFITFDIGALCGGYHSDMTRTYAYGFVSDKQKRVYQIVYDAQKLGLEAVKSGVACKEVDSAARDYIYHAGFEGYFGHSTGHGVGLDIHEMPAVSPKSETVLQSGMVITVEPGIYIPGEFGVRIEDTVVVTSDGYINLCTIPKDIEYCTL